MNRFVFDLPGSINREPDRVQSERQHMATHADMTGAIEAKCDAIKRMLVAKNRAYGNSATDPVRIFSRASNDEQLRVRIDDKLSRLARGTTNAITEDTVLDLVGYLVLLLVSRDREKEIAP